MSATSRGSDRIEADNYPTPGWVTRRLLTGLKCYLGIDLRYASILEPCCGEGAIIRVLRAEGSRGHILGTDVRLEALPYARGAGASRVLEARAQDFRSLPKSDLAITNPPFDQAADDEGESTTGEPIVIPGIINATLQNAHVCAFLLRSAFKLNAFRSNMPDEWKLPQRPEFVASYRCKYLTQAKKRVDGCGWESKVPLAVRLTECPDCHSKTLQRSTSDSSEYSWFVWSERGRDHGITRLLDDTSLAERKLLPEAA